MSELPLTHDQHLAIVDMRKAAYASFAERWPTQAGWLYVAGIAGAAVDILATANPDGCNAFVVAFNDHAARTGLPWRLVARAN